MNLSDILNLDNLPSHFHNEPSRLLVSDSPKAKPRVPVLETNALPTDSGARIDTVMVLPDANLPFAPKRLGITRDAEDWLPETGRSAFIPDLSSPASYFLLRLATKGSYLLRKSTKNPKLVTVYWRSRSSELIKRIAFPETSAAQLTKHLEVLTPAKALIPSVFNFAPEEKLALPQKLQSTVILIGGLHQRYVPTYHYSSFKPDKHQVRFPEVKTLVLQGCRFVGGHALQDWVSRFPDLDHLILVNEKFFSPNTLQSFRELSPGLTISFEGIFEYQKSYSPTGAKYTPTLVDERVRETLAQRRGGDD